MYEDEIWSCRQKIKDCEDEIRNIEDIISNLSEASEQMNGKVTEVSSFADTLMQELRRINNIDCGLLIRRKIINELGSVLYGQDFEDFKDSIGTGASGVCTEIEDREEEIVALNEKITELQETIRRYEAMASEAEMAVAKGAVENG